MFPPTISLAFSRAELSAFQAMTGSPTYLASSRKYWLATVSLNKGTIIGCPSVHITMNVLLQHNMQCIMNKWTSTIRLQSCTYSFDIRKTIYIWFPVQVWIMTLTLSWLTCHTSRCWWCRSRWRCSRSGTYRRSCPAPAQWTVHIGRNISNYNLTAPQSALALAEASQEKARAQIVAGKIIIYIL